MSDVGLLALAALIVTLAGGCGLGWAAGDSALGPPSVQRRAKRIALISVPATVFGLCGFATALHLWTPS
jgi:hypothetical protein